MMNLIRDSWIKAIHLNRDISTISPCHLTQGHNTANPIIDIVSDRPDFKGALYQFLIGLLQTTAPRTEKEWFALWENPPAEDALSTKLSKLADAFNFNADTPSFMQDYELKDAEQKPIAALLIEAPGGKTLKDNLDHFIKRGMVNAVCPHCAALALFTLQINAPSGGVGHRTGLRGGGPLTTLIVPDEGMGENHRPRNTLWHKLWLNVLPEKECRKKLDGYNWDSDAPADLFPWMAPTRTSEKKGGQDTFPENVHPYQMYWAMPRRIRIDFKEVDSGTCDLCGASGQTLIRNFFTKNYGTNYNGTWEHPLTPHSRRQLTDNPLPLHGQKGGVTYRHWLGLTLGDGATQMPARTVNYYLDRRMERISLSRHTRLWAFGFDMDNMKARCWYNSLMPLYETRPETHDPLKDIVAKFIAAAEEVCMNLRQEVRKAWFKRPKDVKGDWGFIDQAFWQATEDQFYRLIKTAIEAIERQSQTGDIAKQWHKSLRSTALKQFDQLVLSGPVEDMELKRVTSARQNLSVWLNTGKMVKNLLSD